MMMLTAQHTALAAMTPAAAAAKTAAVLTAVVDSAANSFNSCSSLHKPSSHRDD